MLDYIHNVISSMTFLLKHLPVSSLYIVFCCDCFSKQNQIAIFFIRRDDAGILWTKAKEKVLNMGKHQVYNVLTEKSAGWDLSYSTLAVYSADFFAVKSGMCCLCVKTFQNSGKPKEARYLMWGKVKTPSLHIERMCDVYCLAYHYHRCTTDLCYLFEMHEKIMYA